MITRMATAMAAVILASACGSTKAGNAQTVEGPVKHPMRVDPNNPVIMAQAARLRFTREGEWQPVASAQGTVLISRDKYGTRLLALRKNAGYDVRLIDLGCAHDGAVHFDGGQGAETDTAEPIALSPAPGFMDLSSEARRLCKQKPYHGRVVTVADAVRGMRAIETQARKPIAPPTELDKAAAIEAMKQWKATHPQGDGAAGR